MAEQKKEQKDTKKEAKAKKPTAVDFLKAHALKGCKDREDCVSKALATAQSRGVDKNSKGRKITTENLTTLLNAMCRDITNGKRGWWSLMSVDETDNSFKFVPK